MIVLKSIFIEVFSQLASQPYLHQKSPNRLHFVGRNPSLSLYKRRTHGENVILNKWSKSLKIELKFPAFFKLLPHFKYSAYNEFTCNMSTVVGKVLFLQNCSFNYLGNNSTM